MITDSIEQKRRIGVAHTKREISPGHSGLSDEERLNRNQESYEAYPIFSAGFAEILETLPDGRMIIQIEMDSRYEMIEETQQVPYKIVRCRLYPDDEAMEEPVEQLREELDRTLLRLPVPNVEKLRAYLESVEWKSQSPAQYSFSIYSLVIFDAEVLQNVLELRSSFERISFLKDALSNPISN
jgi:hypothetical protein